MLRRIIIATFVATLMITGLSVGNAANLPKGKATLLKGQVSLFSFFKLKGKKAIFVLKSRTISTSLQKQFTSFLGAAKSSGAHAGLARCILRPSPKFDQNYCKNVLSRRKARITNRISELKKRKKKADFLVKLLERRLKKVISCKDLLARHKKRYTSNRYGTVGRSKLCEAIAAHTVVKPGSKGFEAYKGPLTQSKLTAWMRK